MLYLDLFNQAYVERTPFGGVTHNRDIDYLKRLYTFNQDAIQSYYQGRNFSVKNTHLISRMVEHFPTYLNTDVYSYLESVQNKLTYLGKHFKLTSEIERGVLHPPYFFGNDGDEVVFGGYDHFDAIAFARNWKNEPCLRVLKHPRDDDKLLLPLGTNDGARSGVSCVYVDLAKLAVKYREFIREGSLATEDKLVLSKNHFVMKYVLAGTMRDVIDHTLLNKVVGRFYNVTPTHPSKRHPFKIYEPSTQLERYVDNTVDMISSKPMDFMQILRHIQLVFHRNSADLLSLPDFYGSRQMMPALVVSRLDHMVFLLDVAKSKQMNKHYINDWQRLAQRVLADNSLGSFFTYEIERDIQEKLRRIIAG
jgi:hypothetical protein